jgi:hypothetical protein
VSKQDDSGPAFPGERRRMEAGYLTNERDPVPGMTLRDYFAAKAMQGILAAKMPITKEMDCCAAVSKVAYMQADAMLKARQS